MHPLITQQADSIDDAGALALRDEIAAAMIADACQVMPSMKQLAMCGASPYAIHRCLLNDAPIHESRLHAIMLRCGLALGVIRIDDCPTIGNA
jgi:hypothetical protein